MPEILQSQLTHIHPGDELTGEIRAALDMVNEAILFVDAFDLCVIDANNAAAGLLEIPRDELVGDSLCGLLPDLVPHTKALDEFLGGSCDAVSVCTALQSIDGRSSPLQLDLRWNDRDVSPVIIVIARPLDERGGPRSSAAPTRDALTGLPARDWWMTQVQHSLDRARRFSLPCAVLFIDLDGFKQVNDSLGHLTGDAVLEIVAKRLLACVRPYDVLSRFGGDEFVVLITDISSEDCIRRIHERIDHALSQPMSAAGISLTVSASIGVACSSADDLSPQDLIERADRAMYAAKRSR